MMNFSNQSLPILYSASLSSVNNASFCARAIVFSRNDMKFLRSACPVWDGSTGFACLAEPGIVHQVVAGRQEHNFLFFMVQRLAVTRPVKEFRAVSNRASRPSSQEKNGENKNARLPVP
ncbi:hypothetical protein [Desulfonatronum thioautotrophicum]|uniref:hypothetical protein n=1 Tax=Desulfonatronum thioautotrophicum TaxID=617001 RepID=UPI001294851B|nr:hypothetical protein [Desulfonatronum thioautotrophicum]